MAKLKSPEWYNNISKALKGRTPWNKGKIGYKRKTKNPQQANKNISEGVKKAWKDGKFKNVDYSKSLEHRKKLSQAKIKYYKEHPEEAKEHGKWVKENQSGKNNPNYGKKHKGLNAKEKNHFWKGGIAYEPYDDGFDKDFKQFIREREDYRCFECSNKITGIERWLHVHHIDYDKKNSKEWNCIALCSSCHGKTKKNREYWKKYFQNKLIQKYPKYAKDLNISITT
jgi:hypothetical protein